LGLNILLLVPRLIEPRDGRESFETETTTFYDPQINEQVPAARLEFMAVMTK